MIYENVRKVYGPYLRKDNRQHVVIVFNDGMKKTVSYPKFLIENYTGNILDLNETVHHIDGDFTNNALTNLEILIRPIHARQHAKKLISQKFICEVCSTEFELVGQKLHDAATNRLKGKVGPFCGRSCAGKASHQTSKYTIQTVKREYTK